MSCSIQLSKPLEHYTHHWSNENAMIEHIQEPHTESIRQEQAAMAITDKFKGQITKKVLDETSFSQC